LLVLTNIGYFRSIHFQKHVTVESTCIMLSNSSILKIVLLGDLVQFSLVQFSDF